MKATGGLSHVDYVKMVEMEAPLFCGAKPGLLGLNLGFFIYTPAVSVLFKQLHVGARRPVAESCPGLFRVWRQ